MKTPAPEALAPNAANYALGARLGMSREQVAAKASAMLAHYRGSGELRDDWHAVLGGWLKNAPKFDQPARASPSSSNGQHDSIYGELVGVEGIRT